MDIRIVMAGLPIATPDVFAVSLGGSETAGLQLGRAFAQKGHQVTIFCKVSSATRHFGSYTYTGDPMSMVHQTPVAASREDANRYVQQHKALHPECGTTLSVMIGPTAGVAR